MAYARYPRLRNYEKRCELETIIQAIKAEWEKACDEVYSRDDDTEEEFRAAQAELDAMQKRLDDMRRYQFSLEFPETKNKWFCGVVAGYADGVHRISDKQRYYFEKYFEQNRDDRKLYCRAAGKFVKLDCYYLTVETIEIPA